MGWDGFPGGRDRVSDGLEVVGGCSELIGYQTETFRVEEGS